MEAASSEGMLQYLFRCIEKNVQTVNSYCIRYFCRYQKLVVGRNNNIWNLDEVYLCCAFSNQIKGIDDHCEFSLNLFQNMRISVTRKMIAATLMTIISFKVEVFKCNIKGRWTDQTLKYILFFVFINIFSRLAHSGII